MQAAHFKQLYEKEQKERDKLTQALTKLMTQQEKTQQLLIKQASQELLISNRVREGSSRSMAQQDLRSQKQFKQQNPITANMILTRQLLTEQSLSSVEQHVPRPKIKENNLNELASSSAETEGHHHIENEGNMARVGRHQLSQKHDAQMHMFMNSELTSVPSENHDEDENQQPRFVILNNNNNNHNN